MSWLRGNGLHRSIFLKFVVAFLAVGLFPLVVLGFMLLNAFSIQSERYNDNNLRQMTLFIAKNSDQIFTVYNNLSKMMYNENWYARMKEAAGAEQTAAIDDLLSSILSSDNYVENVFYIPESGPDSGDMQFLSRRAKTFVAESFPLGDLRLRLNASPDGLAYLATHDETYFRGSDRRLMTFARNLLDSSTMLQARPKVIGTLIFDVDIAVFDNIFSQVSLESDDEIDMIDSEGSISFSNKTARIGQTFQVHDGERSEPDDRIVTAEVPHTEMSIVGHFSRKNFKGIFDQFKDIAVTAVGIGFLFLIALSIAFSRRFSRPIREVIKMMTRMESGVLEVKLPVTSRDELGQLVHGMNRMANKLNQFIQVAYVARIKQEKAELNALKSQIRPHYLYNTLEVIRMSAVSNDDMPVADMIHALSNQLEYVLDYSENVVPLYKELRNVQDYFALIQARYEDELQLAVRTDPEVSMDWGIMKLVLQPLVENAVQHGIVPAIPNGSGGIIVVSLRCETETDSILRIEVRDSGVGMSEEKVGELRTSLNEPSAERGGTGLGLKNVHDRIQSHYGKTFGLEINSRLGSGTSIQLTLPIVKEMESRGANGLFGG